MTWAVLTRLPLETFGCDAITFGAKRSLVWIPFKVLRRFREVVCEGTIHNVVQYLDHMIHFAAQTGQLVGWKDAEDAPPVMICHAGCTHRNNGQDLFIVLSRTDEDKCESVENGAPYIFKFQTRMALDRDSRIGERMGLPAPCDILPSPPNFIEHARGFDGTLRNYYFFPNIRVRKDSHSVQRIIRSMRQRGLIGDREGEFEVSHILESSIKRARARPYEVAPQWVPKTDSFQLLLPLVADSHSAVMGALVLALDSKGGGDYVMITTLTTFQAFNHARVVTHQPPAWLAEVCAARTEAEEDDGDDDGDDHE